MNLDLKQQDILDSPDIGTNITGEDIFKWWESRRLEYNFIVGITGIIMVLLIWLFASKELSVIVLLLGIVYGLGANLCYTLGWILEIILLFQFRKDLSSRNLAWIFFISGLIFSILLTISIGVFVILFGFQTQ